MRFIRRLAEEFLLDRFKSPQQLRQEAASLKRLSAMLKREAGPSEWVWPSIDADAKLALAVKKEFAAQEATP